MTMFKDCYETTVGSVHVTKSIVVAIREAMIKEGLDQNNLGIKEIDGVKAVFITGYHSSETQIPLFAHPITVKNSQGKTCVCADIRLFVRKDTPLDNIEKSIKSLTEFNFTKSRLVLSMLWVTGREEKIKNSLQFAGTVYAAWLSETISKSFALDFKDQTILNIISHYFYLSLFQDKDEYDKEDKERMALQTIKALNAPSAMVFDVYDRVGKLNNIEDYCNEIVRILENVRLKQFNLAVLLTIIGNSWYGTNAKEIIKVALEHPPTWVAVVWTALNERTFKNSLIYRIAERFGKRGASAEFLTAYQHLVTEFIQPKEDHTALIYRDFE